MDIFLFIIYIIVVLGIPYFVIKYVLSTLDKSKYRTLAIVLSIVSCIIFVALLISTRYIPGAVNQYIDAGVNITENKLNEISPGYTEQILDKEKIRNILLDSKQMKHNLNEYTQDVSFITRFMGIDAYLDYFEDFAEKLDENIIFFEQKNIPFTIHNILQYIKNESVVKIEEIVATISLILFIISVVVYSLVLFYVYAIKRKWIDVDHKSVIYGDNI